MCGHVLFYLPMTSPLEKGTFLYEADIMNWRRDTAVRTYPAHSPPLITPITADAVNPSDSVLLAGVLAFPGRAAVGARPVI